MKFSFNKKRFVASIFSVFAAATMLAGCGNVTNNPDKEIDKFQPQSKTMVFEDGRSLIVSTLGYGETHDGFVQVDLTVVNNMDKTVDFYREEPAEDHLNLAAKAYFDGSYIATEPSKSGRNNLLDAELKAHSEDNVNISDYSLNGSIYFEEPEDGWNTMSLVFTLVNGEDTKEIIFNFIK